MKRWLARCLLRLAKRLFENAPKPDDKPALRALIRQLGDRLIDQETLLDFEKRDYRERCHELIEARQMAGAGPWHPGNLSLNVARESAGGTTLGQMIGLREGNPIGAQGATGDIELMLQNVEWRREVNLSWLEFSRWGIQQIILISRLYYIKNPVIRRLIDLDAFYVMGRGIDISSTDPDVNDAIQEFLKLNDKVFGQTALCEHEKRTNYDGNLFFVAFPDDQATGAVPFRLIDATEIQDIVCNPDDSDEEWYFRRTWADRRYVQLEQTAASTTSHEAWYPSVALRMKIDADPVAVDATGAALRQEAIEGVPVKWDQPIIHRKYGAVGKWLFGCPIIYPALDWAKADRRYLEACATLAASHAQIAMTLTTKGGQQALAGVKQQLETTVGPTTQVFDTNPTAVPASIFASGPGTTLAAFHSRGQGLDPKEHVEFMNMACMVMGYPPTMLGDLETANLATATTLDRPTELGVMYRQEVMREVVIQCVTYALMVQIKAPKGKLREALEKRDIRPATVRAIECPRRKLPNGQMIYIAEAKREKPSTDLEIKVTFPAVREGDLPALITATAEAMTLGNKGGQIVGIDEREGVLKLFELLGVENAEEIVDDMYPLTGKDKYDPNRTKPDAAALAPPISSRPPYAPAGPQAPGGHPQPAPKEPVATPGQEALIRRIVSGAIQKLTESRGKAA